MVNVITVGIEVFSVVSGTKKSEEVVQGIEVEPGTTKDVV